VIRQPLGLGLLFGAALAVAGCTRPIETRVTSAGAGLPAPARIAALLPDEDGPAVDLKNQAVIEAALLRHAYIVSPNADYLFDFSLSDRPTTVGIAFSPEGSLPSVGKPGKATKSCAKRSHRMTLSVVDRKSGQSVYRGSAEEYHCRAALSESAAALADILVADLNLPQNSRVLKRQGRN
jgi:hypothetical protein